MSIQELKKNEWMMDNLHNYRFKPIKKLWTLSEKQSKIIEHFKPSKKIFFCVCMYKMIKTSAITWNNAGVSVLKIHENDNVNKTLLLLLWISDISKKIELRKYLWPGW